MIRSPLHLAKLRVELRWDDDAHVPLKAHVSLVGPMYLNYGTRAPLISCNSAGRTTSSGTNVGVGHDGGTQRVNVSVVGSWHESTQRCFVLRSNNYSYTKQKSGCQTGSGLGWLWMGWREEEEGNGFQRIESRGVHNGGSTHLDWRMHGF